MTAPSNINASHPSFVAIPDPRSAGVRAYREPAEPHPLQLTFLEEANERAWIEHVRGLLSAGRTAEADALLSAAVEGFDGSLARLCKMTLTDEVTIDGWEDLLPILAEWEGPAITAITLGLTNPPDLVFEPGKPQEPELLLGLYSDDAFAFSRTGKDGLMAECAKDDPDWAGAEEDVEFHCVTSGLAELNSALIHCKHRYFLRDGRDGIEGRAPGAYVEFVLASWLLATRFLQAAERAIDDHGLPPGCRVIAGTVDVNADFVTVLGPDQPVDIEPKLGASSRQREFAPLKATAWVPRDDPTAEVEAPVQTLRHRLRAAEPQPEEQPRAGFLARLLGRFRRG